MNPWSLGNAPVPFQLIGPWEIWMELWINNCQASFSDWRLKIAVKIPLQYSVSPIYRGRVYRGIGYIAVAGWTPFFCPQISRILQTWCPRAQYFREIAVTPCIQFAGDNFSRNLLTAIAFVPVRWRQFFAKSTRAYLSMRAGTHAVRWAATLGGALTPPLCRRVGSS